MRKYLFWAALMVFCLSSCSSEQEDVVVDDITEADAFVASEQFQEFQEVMQKDSRRMRNLFKKLTINEKICVQELLTSSYTDEATVDSICMRVSSILGIDYKQRILRLMDIYAKTFNGKSFAPSVLLKSMQKYNASIQRIALTRSGNNEAARLECENACGVLYLSYYYGCLSASLGVDYPDGYNGDPHEDWLTFWNCTEQAKWATDDCFESCEQL